MKFRRIAATAAVPVVIVALSACGSQTDGVGANLTAANFSDEVSEAQGDLDSVHMEGTITGTGEGAGPQEVTMSGDMEMGKTLDDVEMDIDASAAGMDIEMVMVDGALYLKSPMPTKGGKPWAKLDLDDPSFPIGDMYSQMMSNANPAGIVKQFDALSEVEKVGADEVDGVDTTHYEVTVDTRKALEAADMVESLGSGADEVLASMPKTMTYDVWVDSDALVKRFSLETGTGMGSVEMDMTFSDWGKDVSVEAPPADQVSEFSF